MASAVDVIIPSAAAVLSAAATWALGRRGQDTAEQDQAFAHAWRLIGELRIEVDRLRKLITELEAHIEGQDRAHAQDRQRWEEERRVLIAAIRRGDNTPPPSVGRR